MCEADADDLDQDVWCGKVRMDPEEVEEERKLRVEEKWEVRDFIDLGGSGNGKMKNGREEKVGEEAG